jgi:uncharacterized protein YlxP (DUF503 family)
VVVGVARLTLALGQSHSLKDKRQVVRKIVDRVRARFLVAISEVSDHDLWQKATLGIAAVGSDSGHVRAVMDEVIRAIDDLYVAPIITCDVQVETYNEFITGPDEAASAGKGPNPFTRELLAGEGADDADESGVDDAPWALPEPATRKRS